MLTVLSFVLPLAAAEPPDLSGTWALEMRAVTATRVAVLGDVESVTRTGVLVRLEPTETGWEQHHLPCGSTIEGGGLVQTRIPDAYFESVRPKVLAVRTDDELGFTVDVQRFTGGWDPAACREVPEVADDACVRDWDGDGKPGITIEVKAPMFRWTEVYVAQQTHPHLEGWIESEHRIAGRLRVTELDNRVLGASNPLFARQPRTRPVHEASTFTMERIPGDATCAEVLEHVGIVR